MNYDIYLRDGCHAEPDLKDLQQDIPELRSPVVQTKLTAYPTPEDNRVPQRHHPRPGFLGLNVTEEQAHELFTRLHTVQAQGEVLPSSYRDPQISKEHALKIAEQKIVQIHEERFPAQHFSPVRLYQDKPRWWVFYVSIKELQAVQAEDLKAGAGGPMVYIDKVDGHVVDSVERQALIRENRYKLS